MVISVSKYFGIRGHIQFYSEIGISLTCDSDIYFWNGISYDYANLLTTIIIVLELLVSILIVFYVPKQQFAKSYYLLRCPQLLLTVSTYFKGDFGKK